MTERLQKLEQLRADVLERPGAVGLYGAGLHAALRALARRSPELAQVAETEAAEWAEVLTCSEPPSHHWSLDR